MMIRSLMKCPSVAALVLFAVALDVQACNSITDAGILYPAFGVVFGTTTISLMQGGTATTFIKVTRSGGLTADITYDITGAPPGLTVSTAPTSVRDSTTLTFTASATLAAGTYAIIVTSAVPTPSVVPEQSTISVTVGPRASGDALAIQIGGRRATVRVEHGRRGVLLG